MKIQRRVGCPPEYSLPSLTLDVLGRRIDCMAVPAIVTAVCQATLSNQPLLVAHYNVHAFNLSMQLPWFYEFLQSADIAHCDSLGIIKMIQFMGLPLSRGYRASYTLLMPRLLAACQWYGLSLFLLGGHPRTLQTALEKQQLRYPSLQIAGHHGYFPLDDPQQNAAVVEAINRCRPDILIVGMGMPRQELWLKLNRHRLQVKVMMTGGAIIDRLAGRVPECPVWVSNLGLEWMFRLCREPRRLGARYLLGNPALLLNLGLARSMGATVALHSQSAPELMSQPSPLLSLSTSQGER